MHAYAASRVERRALSPPSSQSRRFGGLRARRSTQIGAVHVRSRLHTNGAVHYDVLIEKQGTQSLFWYTRYAESAVQIATVIAAFANVPVVNPENV